MEALAENHITVTKSLFTEGMLRIARDGYGKTARRAVLVLLGLWMALLIFTVVSRGDLVLTLGFLVLLSFISLWILVLYPRSQAKRAWKAQIAKYGDPMERTAYFYDDHLLIQGDCVETTIQYSEIAQLHRSRRLLILVTENKVGVMLAQDGFVHLTAQQVEALIKEEQTHD